MGITVLFSKQNDSLLVHIHALSSRAHSYRLLPNTNDEPAYSNFLRIVITFYLFVSDSLHIFKHLQRLCYIFENRSGNLSRNENIVARVEYDVL